METAAASELIRDDGDTRAAERALADPKRTKHSARRAAKRAAVAAKNSSIAAKMGSEELSGEQVDAIARADSKTQGAASSDEGLIADLTSATADETKAIVDKFIVDRADADSVDKEYRRQRALRDVRKHRTSLGLAALTVAGDDASIDAMFRQLRADERALFRRDGGRDVPDSQHPRSYGNRLFDAFKARTTGTGDPMERPIDSTGNQPSGPSATAAGAVSGGRPLGGSAAGLGAVSVAHVVPNAEGTADGDLVERGAAGHPQLSPERANEPPGLRPAAANSRYTPPAARRPTVIAVVDLAKLAGTDSTALAEQIGVGPIADDILAKYLGDTATGVDLVGAIFGVDGRPLWLGRSTKDPNLAQFLALAVRDRGCVECGADPQECHMHHRIPWNAPAKGETDIDNLVLLCSHCHHRLHQQQHTLYRDRTTGKWRKRHATPNEVPPPRPHKQANHGAGSVPPGSRRRKAA